ncbi:MAG TPA: DoxX family protein [Rhizomicrobium sp.]|jgi:putative oxidoreductase|nr:DoxX family protein [Rhizomicrobium sp.]
MNFLNRYSSQILGITRIVTGLAFLEHGTTKFLNFPPGTMHPAVTTLPGAGGLIELITGTLIMLGLFSRCAAFIASGEMAVAYFAVHFKNGGFFPTQNGGDAALLFCFIFLYLAAAGPGSFAINDK